MKTNQSSTFRAALKQELPLWQQEGVANDEAVQRLTQLYQLDTLKQESSRLLAAVLFTLGGLLLGGGIITFVAANWEEIPTVAKVVMLLVTLLTFHVTGFWLWQQKGWSRLGHALVFAGCLVFGANIGLMAQIFHVSGEWYGLFGAWALGSVIMAYAARSWITGVLALFTATIWFGGFTFDHHGEWRTVFPLLVAAVFLPLAWYIHSRVLYVLTFLSITISLAFLTAERYSSGRYVLLAIAVSGLLAWAVGEFHRTSGIKPEFGNPTAGLGLLTLALGAYIAAFHEMWRDYSFDSSVKPFSLTLLLPTVLAGVVAITLLVRSLREQNERTFLQFSVIAASVILSICAILGANHHGDMVLLTIAANIAALLLAGAAIASGLLDERRIAFWFGALFTVVLILSRFLEYETSLLLKSAAFIACGAAVMAAGVAYEKYLRRKELNV